jgi:hypothetical protein
MTTGLSREVFAQYMTALCDRFNRTLAPPAMVIYYDFLRGLSDYEFRNGIRGAFNCTFFPSPQDIFCLGRPSESTALVAENAWSEVLSAIRGTPWRMIPRAKFNEVAWKAIASAGGLSGIAEMTREDEPHARKRFLDAYVDRVEQARRKSLADIDVEVAALVGDTARQLGGGPLR